MVKINWQHSKQNIWDNYVRKIQVLASEHTSFTIKLPLLVYDYLMREGINGYMNKIKELKNGYVWVLMSKNKE